MKINLSLLIVRCRVLIVVLSVLLFHGLGLAQVTNPPLPGLVGHWQFEEGNGTSTADQSTNRFTATLNGPAWVASPLGQYALEFDGVDDGVDVGNPPAMQITGALTLTAWVFADSIAGNGRFIAKGGASGQRGWSLNLESANTWSFQVAGNATTSVGLNVPNVIIGQWVHVAGVYDPTVPVMRLYLYGQLAGEMTNAPTSQFNSPVNVNIGRRANGTFFDGKLDEIRVFNRALTTEEIQALPEVVSRPVMFLSEPVNRNVAQFRPVTFSTTVSGSPPYFYQWLSNGMVIPDATGPAYTIDRITPAMDGSSFSVMVSNLTSSITSSNAVLTVSDDTVDPLLLSVGSPDGVTVGVCFNELVDSESAEDPFNYAINGSLVVATARVRPDGRSVRLTLTAPITGVFTLEVNDVRDLAGNSVAINSTANGVVAGLTSADIGLPIATGSIYSCTNGDFEVIAGGDGLSGPDDQGHFALKSVTGDFDVKVRVLGIPNSQGAAGLVLRESFQAGTQSIHLLANSSPPPNALGFIRTGQRMFVDGGIRSWGSGYSFETRPDVWLRLRRTSDLYTRFYSTNGTDWILIESLALDLSPQALVGLAATANDDEAPAVLAHLRNFGEMTFSNPSLHLGENPADTTVPQNTDVNFSAHAAGSGAPDSELVYQWQRGDGSGSFTNVIGANSPTFGIFARPQDHGAIFRVRVHLAGLVMDSQVATLTLTPDVTLPRIQSVVAPGQGNQVNVTFSEAVAAASGTNLLHYAITNLSTGLRVGITSVSQSPDGRTITLLTDLLAEGPSYEITVGGVEDLGDPPNTILSGTRAEFRHDSLVGYWQFEEGTGTTTADASGNGFTGTLVNGPTWVAGAAGRHALEFDGSNDRVDLGNPEVLQITGPLTLAAWVYPDSTTDNGRIITKGGGPGQRGWALNVEGINAWSFQIAVSGSANISVLVTNVPLRRWTHVAGVYDPSVPSLRLYTNGVLGGEVTAGVPTSQFNPPLNVSIGARPIQQTFFDGKIDEVRVHARALGAPQIAGLARPLFLPAVILGNQIQLDWVGVGRLEQAPAMSGPWTPIMPAPVAPYVEVVVPTVNRFFRLNATP